MSQVFLDTSVVYDFCFRGSIKRRALEQRFQGKALVTSSYVVFELSRGAIRNLILTFNKAQELTGLSDLLEYCSRLRMRSHHQGTAIGAIATLFREEFDRSMPGALSDEEKLTLLARQLSRMIRQGFDRANRLGHRTNPSSCREDLGIPFESDCGMDQKLPKDKCGETKNCGIIQFLVSRRSEVDALREAIASANDSESIKRRAALRRLVRCKSTQFKRGDCYYCGDAIIAMEAPAGASIATKNVRHFNAICETLEIEVEEVTD